MSASRWRSTIIWPDDEETPKGSVSLVNEMEYYYRDAMALYFEEHRDEAVDVQLEGRIRDLAKEQ